MWLFLSDCHSFNTFKIIEHNLLLPKNNCHSLLIFRIVSSKRIQISTGIRSRISAVRMVVLDRMNWDSKPFPDGTGSNWRNKISDFRFSVWALRLGFSLFGWRPCSLETASLLIKLPTDKTGTTTQYNATQRNNMGCWDLYLPEHFYFSWLLRFFSIFLYPLAMD